MGWFSNDGDFDTWIDGIRHDANRRGDHATQRHCDEITRLRESVAALRAHCDQEVPTMSRTFRIEITQRQADALLAAITLHHTQHEDDPAEKRTLAACDAVLSKLRNAGWKYTPRYLQHDPDPA